MRILHVVEATIAGVRTHVQALATGLDRRRFQSVVVCPPRREHSFGDERFVTYLTSAGIPVLPVPMRRSISPVADVAALSRLFAILRRERFDIVHLHSSKAGFLGRLAARMAGGAAVIYSPHGLSFLGNHGPATRRLYLTLEQIGGRMCDRIIATSASERATIVARRLAPAGKVAQIDLGIDPDPLPPGFDRTAQRTALGIPDGARLIGALPRSGAPRRRPAGAGCVRPVLADFRLRVVRHGDG